MTGIRLVPLDQDDGTRGDLDLLFTSPKVHSKGIVSAYIADYFTMELCIRFDSK